MCLGNWDKLHFFWCFNKKMHIQEIWNHLKVLTPIYYGFMDLFELILVPVWKLSYWTWKFLFPCEILIDVLKLPFLIFPIRILVHDFTTNWKFSWNKQIWENLSWWSTWLRFSFAIKLGLNWTYDFHNCHQSVKMTGKTGK